MSSSFYISHTRVCVCIIQKQLLICSTAHILLIIKIFNIMAKVILAPFIESISGKVGNLQFRTLKSGRTVVHARRGMSEEGIVHRSTPPTQAEIAHRKRFGMVSSITAEIQGRYARIDKAAADRQQIWLKVKYLYDKHVNDVEDEKELRKLILAKYDKSTSKPR